MLSIASIEIGLMPRASSLKEEYVLVITLLLNYPARLTPRRRATAKPMRALLVKGTLVNSPSSIRGLQPFVG
eukprot:560951-Prorocentrum_minimum.AAC.1